MPVFFLLNFFLEIFFLMIFIFWGVFFLFVEEILALVLFYLQKWGAVRDLKYHVANKTWEVMVLDYHGGEGGACETTTYAPLCRMNDVWT
jgi:hypothetical protein